MEIKRVDTQASASSSATASAVAALSRDKPTGQEGPAEWFMGKVWIQSLFEPPDPARICCASVTFEPCARTAWHTHPLGQTLIVTSGVGWAQVEGGRIEEIRPGDVVWFPPNEKTLARRNANERDESYCDSRGTARQSRRMARARN
jgi:quercetin dioxygenase-like cupin family protein